MPQLLRCTRKMCFSSARRRRGRGEARKFEYANFWMGWPFVTTDKNARSYIFGSPPSKNAIGTNGGTEEEKNCTFFLERNAADDTAGTW
jgi:hypothetical protein